MSKRAAMAGPAALAAMIAVAASGCGGGDSPSQPAARPSASGLAVTSSLDRRRVLPHHVVWLAFPKMPATQVREVEFLIDGKTAWTEDLPPYVYAGDNDGADRGMLVTSFLRPGPHRFTVRVHTVDGRSAIDTVTARVAPSVAVPAALAGTWRRTLKHVVPADRNAVRGTQPNPAGTYTVTFDRRWIEDRYPGKFSAQNEICKGCILNDDYVPGPHTFGVWGSVIDSPSATWDGQPRGGWWCDPDGPPATYSWSVSGKTLTLTPQGGSDACRQRGSTWAGRWTRVG
jgi:hypothetical protein